MTTRTRLVQPRGVRRPTEWFDLFNVGITISASGQVSRDLLGLVPLGMKKGSTVTRTLIDLVVRPQGTIIYSNLTWGIVMIDDDAAAGGAIPDSDEAADQSGWLGRGLVPCVTSNTSNLMPSMPVRIDLSSQRRFRGEDESLYLVFDKDSTAITLEIDFFARVLLKKP